jgi:arginine decarboxylase
MKIHLSTGTGEGPTALAAFDAALWDAGIANYNLIHLSSVIPPGSTVERSPWLAIRDEYGHRLYVVMATSSVSEPGRSAWAGLGWVQDASDGRGLFVELVGETGRQVDLDIESTLRSMVASRGRSYGPIEREVVGISCRERPACAIVIAVYRCEGWA